MTTTIADILNSYKNETRNIEESDLNEFGNVEKGISISRECLQKLRFCIRNNEFQSKTDEIKFFKEQKPYVYGRLKFYVKVYKFLMHRPMGSIKSQRNYIDSVIEKLQGHNQKNIDFVKYYRERSTLLDEFYFLRGKDKIDLISDTSHFYTDPEFCTSHDNAVAKILAYDLLLNHYTNELNDLKKSTRKISSNEKLLESLNLNWTSNKIDLIELIYALIASGAVKGDIKELATAFEKILDIDLGNYYRSFLEIRGRKEDFARFLDLLKISLIKKIREADD